MLRDPSFLDDVPEEHTKDFVDSDKLAPYKLKILKKMIHDRFPVSKIIVWNFCDAWNLFDLRLTPVTGQLRNVKVM